jgi:Zn-dependent peptidase ImmA (M78 family)
MEYRLKSNVAEFRNRFGYNTTEPINFYSLLQKLDILTLFKPLSEDFSGLSIKSDENRFMLVNCNHSLGRQNFTIGHELYHLFYDKSFVTHKCQTGIFPRKNINEWMADLFSSHLLLPEDGIAQLIPDEEIGKDQIRLATILKIEQTYGSSRAALLTQLEKMGIISKSFIPKQSTNIKTGARQFGYFTELYEHTSEKAILGTYGSLANKLYEKDLISEGHYLELMMAIGVDVNEIFLDEDD